MQDDVIVYEARRSFFNKTCSFKDSRGDEIFLIKRIFSPFSRKYVIYYEGEIFARIESKSILKSGMIATTADKKYYIQPSDFFQKITIVESGIEIAKISRKRMAVKNKIGVAIQPDQDDELILSFALMIELVIRSRKSKSS